MKELKKKEETEAYITVKDHKEGFPQKLSFQLINPSKSDIRKISKNLLDKINKILILKNHCQPMEKNPNSY